MARRRRRNLNIFLNYAHFIENEKEFRQPPRTLNLYPVHTLMSEGLSGNGDNISQRSDESVVLLWDCHYLYRRYKKKKRHVKENVHGTASCGLSRPLNEYFNWYLSRMGVVGLLESESYFNVS